MIYGLILFVLVFILIAPKSQAFLGVLAADAGKWISDWAPFSYIIVLFMVVAPFVAIHLIRSWPERVEEGNPMSKYKKQDDVVED
jgi:hypothetical protein